MQLPNSCSSPSLLRLLIHPHCKFAGFKHAYLVSLCPTRRHVACRRVSNTTESDIRHDSVHL